jgi:hypothetical protein
MKHLYKHEKNAGIRKENEKSEDGCSLDLMLGQTILRKTLDTTYYLEQVDSPRYYQEKI